MTKHKTQIPAAPLYLPADFFLLRAPALAARTFQQLGMLTKTQHASTTRPDSLLQKQTAAIAAFLLSLDSSFPVESAIALASPSLYKGLARLRSGEIDARREKHIFAGLLRYLIRMSTRPTPFGLFAGVAPGFFGEETTLQLGVPALGRWRARPDMNWLLAFLKDLEASPSLLTHLTVQRNQLVYLVGERIILLDDDPYGQKQDQTLSLRASHAVRKALELAHEPVAYLALRDALQASFPGVKPEKIVRLLGQLWEHGLLISTLHPSLTDVQPASTLLRQLEKLEGTDEARQLLTSVLAFSAAIDQDRAGRSPDFPAELIALQHGQTSSRRYASPIQVDSLLSLSAPTLHKDIGTVAARAAELLLRFTPFPQSAPHLQVYRHRFLEKYGPGAEVPLLELLSPELGLDAPPGYTRPPCTFQQNGTDQHPLQERRERTLQALMQEALVDRSLEVELSEDHLAALETWQPRIQQAPLSLEIYLHIHATSRQALDEGKFWAIVGPNPGSTGAGRSFGRFLDLPGMHALNALRQLLAREEALEAEAVFAEFSYQPTDAREANVALRPLLRTYEIAVGTAPILPSAHVIPLHDLLVGIRDERFYLYSRRLNKRVIVCQLHMLTAVQAPNVCRFLTEIAADGLPVLTGFDWGSLAGAPFLPRVTVPHGQQAKLILTPACWNLQATTIQPQGEGDPEMRLFTGLQRWRSRWRVPRYVYLTELDNRLLLDLEHPQMAVELFKALTALKGEQALTLQEQLPDFEHLWLTDTQGDAYFAEVVIPLLRCDAPPVPRPGIPELDARRPPASASLSSASPPASAHVAARQERVFYPGDIWSYVKLYCTHAQQEEVIAGPLREIIRELRESRLIDGWFFLRYADPQPHLRLRIHASAVEDIRPVLDSLLAWSRRLASRGQVQRYVLDTYEREVARYGGPASMDLLEQVFCLDSDLCSSLVAAHYTGGLTLDPLATAVMSLDCLLAAWGYTREQRFQWLHTRAERDHFRKQFYPERRSYSELLSPWNRQPDPHLSVQRELLSALLAPLEAQLSPIGTRIRELARANQLWATEEELLASLAHLHKVRLLDLNRQTEQKIYAFWYLTLESILLRPARKAGAS